MLPYVRTYRLGSYLLSGLVAAAVLFTIAFYSGGTENLFSSPVGWLGVFAAFFIPNLFVTHYVNKAATKHTQRLSNIFDQHCDPALFIEKGRSIAHEIVKRPPIGEWGSKFLSNYCTALIDQGIRDEAHHCLAEIYRSAQTAKSPKTRYELYMSLYAPTKDLYGLDLAEECLVKAQEIVNGDPVLSRFEDLGLTAWAHLVLNAEKTGNIEALIKQYEQILTNESQLPRLRVWAAYKAASLYEMLGEEVQEALLLHYVIERGNTMSCVAAAQNKLARFVR